MSVKTRFRNRSPKRSTERSIRRISMMSLPIPMITPPRSGALRPSGRAFFASSVQPDEDRFTDQEMADIEFSNLGIAATGFTLSNVRP
jgi:hypothetical protein